MKAERRKKTQLPVCLWATPPTPTPHLCHPIREEADLPPKASASGRCWTPRGPEDTEEHQPHYQQDPGDTEEHQLVSQSAAVAAALSSHWQKHYHCLSVCFGFHRTACWEKEQKIKNKIQFSLVRLNKEKEREITEQKYSNNSATPNTKNLQCFG